MLDFMAKLAAWCLRRDPSALGGLPLPRSQTDAAPRPRHVWLEPRAPDRSVTRAALILLAPAREAMSQRSLPAAA